jgi:hypothetical protein
VRSGDRGWVAYGPVPGVLPPPARPGDGELRPELADVGRLLRRAVHGVVGAARAGERSTLSRLLVEHLGADDEHEVVAESWPAYEHVNVQAGLDAWAASERRGTEVVGIVG